LIQDYGFRLYNSAIAKFLSVDPLAPDYPWYTPYQFAGNKPINSIDIDGLEEGHAIRQDINVKNGHPELNIVDAETAGNIADAVTTPIRAAATGGSVFFNGIGNIPAYASGDFSSSHTYYDYLNWREVQSGSFQSDQTLNQVSVIAAEEYSMAAAGGLIGKVVGGVYTVYRKVQRTPGVALEEIYQVPVPVVKGKFFEKSVPDPAGSRLGVFNVFGRGSLPSKPWRNPVTGRYSTNYRRNLRAATQKWGDGYDAHHTFPKGRKFKKYFRRNGIDINDPMNLIWRHKDVHSKTRSGALNSREHLKLWREFMQNNPNPSQRQLYQARDNIEKAVWGNTTGDTPPH